MDYPEKGTKLNHISVFLWLLRKRCLCVWKDERKVRAEPTDLLHLQMFFMFDQVNLLLLCREDAMFWSLCVLCLQELHERQFAHQRVCKVSSGDHRLCLHLPGCQSAAGKTWHSSHCLRKISIPWPHILKVNYVDILSRILRSLGCVFYTRLSLTVNYQPSWFRIIPVTQ